MVKASELKGRAVLSLERVQKIGTIQAVIFDPDAARVAGLRVGGQESRGGTVFVPAQAVYRVGPDAVTVQDAGQDFGGDAAAWQHLPGSDALSHTKVVTDAGTLLGTITDVVIDETNLQIQGYELSGSMMDELTGKTRLLPAQAGYRYGQNLLLVPEGVAAAVRGTEQQRAPDAGATEPAAPVVQPSPAPAGASPVVTPPAGTAPDASVVQPARGEAAAPLTVPPSSAPTEAVAVPPAAPPAADAPRTAYVPRVTPTGEPLPPAAGGVEDPTRRDDPGYR